MEYGLSLHPYYYPSLIIFYLCFNCVVGEDVVVKLTSDDEAKGSSKSVGVLQAWSAKWSCYVDVSDLTEIGEGDRITVLVKDSVKKNNTEVHCYTTRF